MSLQILGNHHSLTNPLEQSLPFSEPGRIELVFCSFFPAQLCKHCVATGRGCRHTAGQLLSLAEANNPYLSPLRWSAWQPSRVP